MKVTAIKCPKCKDTVYSRARHDYRSCTCGSVSIDGGQEDYIRVSGANRTFELDLGHKISKQDIYDDWNKSIDKLGLVKGKKTRVKGKNTRSRIKAI